MYTLQELLTKVLFGEDTKKVPPKETEDANIPTPQDFGAFALTKRKTKKKKDEAEKPKLEEARSGLAWKHFWWVRKGDDVGHATFSVKAEEVARPGGGGTSRDVPTATRTKRYIPMYQKPLLVQWLATPKDLAKVDAKDMWDYIKIKKLPSSIPLSVSATNIIMRAVEGFLRRNIGDRELDDLSPKEVKELENLEDQTAAAMRQLPIDLDNKKLTPGQTEKLKQFMAKGPGGKYAAANVSPVLKSEDIPAVKAMAKRALGGASKTTETKEQ